MRRIDRRHLLPGAAAFAAALLVALLGLNAGADQPDSKSRAGTVELQLLGVNDFHGHLEPPEPDVGGAAWLGAWLNRAATSHPERTIRVHAGDMVGASPLISSHWHDVPTIEATNLMRFDVGTLGNHEFDRGVTEMLRQVSGGRSTVDPSITFDRLDFPMVDANGAVLGIRLRRADGPSSSRGIYLWLRSPSEPMRWASRCAGSGQEISRSGALLRWDTREDRATIT